MNELASLQVTQAVALVTGFIERFNQGQVSREAFQKLAAEALKDGRLSVLTPIAAAYPVPIADDTTETDMMEARLDAIRATLPGIYGPVHAAGYRMQQTILQAEKEYEAQSPLVDYREELGAKLDEYPIWRSFVIHEDAVIRLLALNRLGGFANPLQEPAIVFMLGDPNSVVRARARDLIGEPAPIKHRSTYSAKDVAHRGTIQQAIRQIVDLSTDDELRGFLDDPRTSVRFAAAIKLPEDSGLWSVTALDASARVRRVTAERVPLRNKEIVSQLLQDVQQSVRSAIGRRVLEQDITLPPPSPVIAAKREWAERMENDRGN